MNVVNLSGKEYTSIGGFWQWDREQKLQIEGLEYLEKTEIHFSLQETGGGAIKKEGRVEGEIIEVDIPQFIFEKNTTTDYTAYCFVYPCDEESGETTHKIRIFVNARPKPDDYVYEEDEVLTWKQLDERITKLEEGGIGGNVETDPSLTKEGTAADAKATGDAIRKLSESVEELKEDVGEAEVLLAAI